MASKISRLENNSMKWLVPITYSEAPKTVEYEDDIISVLDVVLYLMF